MSDCRRLFSLTFVLSLALGAAACGDDPQDSVPDADVFNPTPGNPTPGGADGGYGSGDGGGGVIPPDAVIHRCYRDADCAAFERCELSLSPQDCVPREGRCASDADCEASKGEKCDGDHYCAIDACEGVTCSDGGVCSTEGGQAVCNCPHGHTANGTRCEPAQGSVGWCGIQWAGQWQDKGYGATLQYEKGQADSATDIYGQVWIEGVTGKNQSCVSGHQMQLGVTDRSVTYPVVAGNFTWTEMRCNGNRGNNDEFKGQFPTDTEGAFNWVIRFSPNGGQDWFYGDAQPDFITSSTMKVGTAQVGEGSGGGGDGPVVIAPTGSWLSLAMKQPTNGSSQTGGYEFTVQYALSDDPTATLPKAKITRNGEAFDLVAAFLNKGADGTWTQGTLTLDFSQMAEKKITVRESGLTAGKYTWLFRLEGYRALYVPIWVESERFEWEDGFLYQVMTDRFADGDASNNAPIGTQDPLNDWMGGDLKGLTQKLNDGYFDDLSVNTLWISSPIVGTDGYGLGVVNGQNQKYAAYHAYWPIATGWTDTNQQAFIDAGIRTPIEPHFGSEADLRAFIQAAHQKGIRVLVDFVANHVFGISNPAEASGSQSPLWPLYKDEGWFNTDPIKFCGDYTDGVMNYDHSYWTFRCWFNAYLADFDFDGSAAALQLVLDHAIWLAQEFDFDGFRLDAVKHMSMKFTTGIRARIKSDLETTGLTFYTVGETFDGNEKNLVNWIGDDKLTGQFSFAFYYKILNPLLQNNGSYGDMGHGITYLDTYFRHVYGQAIMPNFMGNHDVERALQLAGGDHARLRRAQTVVMTSPEMPLIYQGDDVGMMGGKDPDNRRMMVFGGSLSGEQQATLKHLKTLARARKLNQAFRYGKRTNCKNENDVWVYKMERDGNVAIVGINRGGSAASGSCAGVGASLTDVINGGSSANGSFSIPAGGSAVYVVNR